MNVNIIYEDNHLLVVEKPVNVPVQEDQSKDPDLLTILKEDIKVRYNKPGNVYLALVHRLDRPAGGAMVFAKTSKAASRLSDQLRRKVIKRSYLAVVRGVVPTNHETLEDYLVKDSNTNTVKVSSSKDRNAKLAVLSYTLVDQADGFSLLQVDLQTGRPHQIRVQLASRGYPLFGDQKYGQAVNKPGQQLALWSNQLSFEHPTKKEPLTFASLPPTKHPWDLFSIQ